MEWRSGFAGDSKELCSGLGRLEWARGVGDGWNLGDWKEVQTGDIHIREHRVDDIRSHKIGRDQQWSEGRSRRARF